MSVHDKEEAAIRAYLTASDAEREPVIHAEFETVVGGLIGTTSAPIKRVERQDDGSLTVVIDHWPPHTVRELEAENARLQAEVARLEKADETRAQDISRLTTERDAARDRLAEALQALEPFALVAEHDISEDEADTDPFRPMPKPFNHAPQITVGHLRAARHVREGEKVDG